MLACSRCGKPFEKESTLKRHGYYCRSKKPGHSTSRKRSCAACARAKIRCDWKLPRCSNCVSKNIECIYPQETLHNLDALLPMVEKETEALDDINVGQPPLLTSYKSEPTIEYMPNEATTSAVGSTYTEEDWNGLLTLDSTFPSPEISVDVADNEDLGTLFEKLTPPIFGHSGFHRETFLREMEKNTTVTFRPPYSVLHLTFENSLMYPWSSAPRSLNRRPLAKPHFKTPASVLIQILASFPIMMIRKEVFPPFIHPSIISVKAGKENVISETIATCMSLAQMFQTRTKGNRRLVWRFIQFEHERLWRDYHCFDDFELLASTQALLIYILMRMVDGENEDNNFDVPLLLSLNAISSTLEERVCSKDITRETESEERDWHEWIFHESRRRFVTVARIMNMLVNMDHAISCAPHPDFALVPLPAEKTLWEARSARQWRTEYERTSQSKEVFGLSNRGQLIKLQQSFGHVASDPVEWDEWYASSDRFGTMVMITASLLE